MLTNSNLTVIASALALGLAISIVYTLCQVHRINAGQLFHSTLTGRNG